MVPEKFRHFFAMPLRLFLWKEVNACTAGVALACFDAFQRNENDRLTQISIHEKEVYVSIRIL
jgi:hypothetical protein